MQIATLTSSVDDYRRKAEESKSRVQRLQNQRDAAVRREADLDDDLSSLRLKVEELESERERLSGEVSAFSAHRSPA
jgi:chromosome segregation ATPase